MPESLSDLYRQHDEIMAKILKHQRREAESLEQLTEYDVSYKNGVMTITVYDYTPPTTKVFSKFAFRGSFDNNHEYYRALWINLIKQAKEQLVRQGGTIKPIHKSLVFTTFFEKDSILRDADNYGLYLLHNALVINNIIAEDNIKQMRYIHTVAGEKGKRKATKIVVLKNDGSWIKHKDCNNCILNLQFKGMD